MPVCEKGDPCASEAIGEDLNILERLRSLESRVAMLEQDRGLHKQKIEQEVNTVKRLKSALEGKPPRYSDAVEADWTDKDGSRLLSAFYHNVDVTVEVAKMLEQNNGILQFEYGACTVNRKLGVDPAYGVGKVLCLTWIDRTGNFNRTAIREGDLDTGRAYNIFGDYV